MYLEKPFNSKQKKLWISIQGSIRVEEKEESIEQAVVKALVNLGGVYKAGVAPPGWIVNQLQAYLDQMENAKF